jgi:predicted ribosomally synthesized peptide with SipW-like signal peptide
MKNSKIWIILTALVLVLSISVAGTLAFLLDTETVVNTFTVGNVHLKLDEAAVDGNGIADPNADRVTSNSYKLLPGGVYQKDPTVTVLSGSENAYVRMIMTVHNHAAVQAIVDNPTHNLPDYSGLFGGWNETAWNYYGYSVDAAADTISFEFRFHQIVAGQDASGAPADVVLPALFTQILVPGTISGEELAALIGTGGEPFQIDVEAHAIQSYSFADADAAWAAFDVQYAG